MYSTAPADWAKIISNRLQCLLPFGWKKTNGKFWLSLLLLNYKIWKPLKVCSTNENTVYLDIVVDTLAPYQLIICLDYLLRASIDLMKENGFKLAKERSGRYPTKYDTETDCAEDIALQADKPTQTKTLLHSPERAAAGIGLHFNVDKTNYRCLNQSGHTSALKEGPLKLVDKFT